MLRSFLVLSVATSCLMAGGAHALSGDVTNSVGRASSDDHGFLSVNHNDTAMTMAAGPAAFGDVSVTGGTRSYAAAAGLDPFLTFSTDPALAAVTAIGSQTTQGDARVQAPAARTNFGVDGTGIKIGIISDSFDKNGTGFNSQITNGDLPGIGNPNGYTTPITIIGEDTNPARIDEGRAMAEIIHDIAPGAEIYFHSAFNQGVGNVTIANAIDDLVAAGVDIIVDDVSYLTQPIFQDGVVSQAVDNAFANGVAYFSSAGNFGTAAYEGTFTDSGDNDGFHEFSTGDELFGFTIPGTSGANDFNEVRIMLQWDDPYLSQTLGGGGTATADYDLLIVDANNPNTILATSTRDQQAGQDAYEFVGLTYGSATQALPAIDLAVVVQQFGTVGGAQDPADFIKFFFDSWNLSLDPVDDTNSSTVFGHHDALGQMGVAAAFHSSNTVEPFSSRGPSQKFFDAFGNPINEVRDSPNITGPDGVITTTPGFGAFFGTSAAAPHVAAVAVLMLDYATDLGLSLSPAQIYEIIELTAVDLHGPGFDTRSGFGMVDANAALTYISGLADIVPAPAGMGLALLGLCVALSRRRSQSAAF